MKFKTISLPEKTPRDALQIKKKLPLHRGLIPFYFFGVFSLIAPFFPIILVSNFGNIGKIGWVPLLFFFSSAEIIAFVLLFYANKNYLKRLRTFTNGIPIKASVIQHSRNFVFWKSERNYRLTVKYNLNNQSILSSFSSAFSEIHKQYPVNSEINGLYDSDSESVFFPAEIGLIIETLKTSNK